MIDRRGFLATTVTGGAGLVLGSACAPDAGTRAGERGGGAVPPFELEEIDVATLQRGMETGEWSAREVAELYLGRIEALNLVGPELRAVIETNPDARAIADALDAERRAGGPRGPLHGIPVLIKDNIDTSDGMTTTAGSLALEGSKPPRDSFVAERLRAAGAIILGKANLSEWANFRGQRSTSGWSARGGQCRNPYALDRNPCGSSAGSGVAAAASLAALTIGTETSGSITCPSAINGIVGIKPTVGLWSRSGIIPISHSQDTAGPMCRTVRDAVTLLGAVTGVDARDPATAASRGNALGDYTPFLDEGGLRGKRIGVARSMVGSDPRVLALFEASLDALRGGGATVVDPVGLDPDAWNTPLQLVVLEYELKAGLDAYLAALGPGAPVRSLADVIAFNERNVDREMAFFGQEYMIASEARGPLTDPGYQVALRTIQRANREDGIDRVMAEHELDAIVAPTSGIAWPTDHILGDRFDGGSAWDAAAIAGYPHMTIPMGFVAGLPAGVSFFGAAWSEPTLIEIAYAYEQATNHRAPPTFAQTLG